METGSPDVGVDEPVVPGGGQSDEVTAVKAHVHLVSETGGAADDLNVGLGLLDDQLALTAAPEFLQETHAGGVGVGRGIGGGLGAAGQGREESPSQSPRLPCSLLSVVAEAGEWSRSAQGCASST